jgi:DNA-binding beta-propeller fold protein YncE
VGAREIAPPPDANETTTAHVSGDPVKLTRLAGAAAGALAAAALLAGPASAHPGSPGALFVQTDNPAGNAVVAYDRAAGGGLRQAATYRTGGLGGVLGGSVVDHLASQGSLTYDRASGLLYAVNAGSDTLTVFAVDGDRLSRRQVIPSFGDFPVSVAAHDRLVYVLNARHGGSVQGYVRVGDHLLPIPAWHRRLGLDPAATPEFTTTPGQVAFTPDGRRLVVTTKANGNAVDVFGLDRFGGPSAQPVSTVLPGAVPFAVAFDVRGNLVLSEAGPNAVATFRLDGRGALVPIGQAPTGQAATCWITSVNGRLYLSNAGSGTVSAFDAALAPVGLTATRGGTVDSTATPDGRFLYVQTGADGGVDAFRIAADGGLTPAGTVTVPGAGGGEGIAAT